MKNVVLLVLSGTTVDTLNNTTSLDWHYFPRLMWWLCDVMILY